ncbi:universal stress protein [Robiginitalea sp. IMCC43444]|uniref:universal stress protein n=1 Tax=Robiginitalea sp. IMCC43444 TaxID=3459121 RepID=UPI00404359B3
MKTILIPTDFSRNAWNALFTLLKLFTHQQARILILNTYEPQLANLLGDRSELRLGAIYESLGKESREQMQDLLGYLQQNHHNPRHQFEAIHRSGDLLQALRALTNEYPVDLIVMGTQGATGAKKVFLGSNTVRVLKAIRNKPLLVVPEDFDFQQLRTVVFPTDYIKYYEPYEISILLDLVKVWDARLQIVYVGSEFKLTSNQESHQKLLSAKLKGIPHSFVNQKLKGSVSDTIRDYAENKDAELIALVHYKHSILEVLTHNPVSKRIAFETRIPLLVLPELKRD